MLRTLHIWISETLPGRAPRYGVAVVLVAVFFLPTLGVLQVPFVLGWQSSDRLLTYEEELQRLRRETAEGAAAAQFFKTPDGREFARKLMHNHLEEGERRVVPEPIPDEQDPGVSQRVGEWVHVHKDGLTAHARHSLAVIKRWVVAPPELAPGTPEPETPAVSAP